VLTPNRFLTRINALAPFSGYLPPTNIHRQVL
jgi:hypothetical protein